MNKILPVAVLALLTAAVSSASAQTAAQTTTPSMPIKGSGTSMNGLNMGSSSMKTPSMGAGSMNSGNMPKHSVASSMSGRASSTRMSGMMNGMGFKKSDMAFVRTATFGNTFEIDAARLALQDSKNAQVRAYANKMITDHTNLGSAMKAAVHQVDARYVLPSGLTTVQNRLMNNMRRARDFDAVYKADMIKSHTQTYDLFRRYDRSSTACKEVKAVAQKYTPVVKSHLNMAFQLPRT